MKKILVYPILIVLLSSVLGACEAQTGETSELIEEQVAGKKAGSEATEIHSDHWSYEGETGPEHWNELDPKNSACLNGSEQSQINIEFSQVQAKQAAEGLQIKYKPSSFTLMNNGHTVQANAVGDSSTILIEGKEYRLAQFHFHTPSEHQFNGQNYDMELHLVHRNMDGEIAVLGVMIKEGGENKHLTPLWDVLPKEKTEKDLSLNELVDLEALLPKDRTAFHYDGSLTTPPCTEGVKWTVFEKPIEMSKAQIEVFRQIFPDNHRPSQSLNQRKIVKG